MLNYEQVSQFRRQSTVSSFSAMGKSGRPLVTVTVDPLSADCFVTVVIYEPLVLFCSLSLVLGIRTYWVAAESRHPAD